MRLAGTATGSFGTDELFSEKIFSLHVVPDATYETFAFWHSKEVCLVLFFRSAYDVDADHFISVNDDDDERVTDDIVEIVTKGDGYFMLRCRHDNWTLD